MADAVFCPRRRAHTIPARPHYVLIRCITDTEGARYVMRFLCTEHAAEERTWNSQGTHPVHMESYRPTPGKYTDQWLAEKIRQITKSPELELRFDEKGSAWL